MYYPSILLCIVLLYFLGGKQSKVRVANDPLRHLSFHWWRVWCKVQNRLQSLGTNWQAKTEQGNHRYTSSQDARKAKNNPDEVQPTSQPELNSVKWLARGWYKKREVDHYTARRLTDGGSGESFHETDLEQGHTYTNPQPGWHLTHAHGHITRAVLGSRSHGQLFRPCWDSPAWDSRRVKDPFLPRNQLHTTHVGAVGWEPHGSSPTA